MSGRKRRPEKATEDVVTKARSFVVDLDAELLVRQRLFFMSVKSHHPLQVIESFLRNFHLRKADGRAVLSRVPPDYVLEWLADRFNSYRRGKGSLDQAFGLVSISKGRGAASPKEIYKKKEQAWWAAWWFQIFLEEERSHPQADGMRNESARNRALRRTGERLNCGTRKVENLLAYRRRNPL